MKRSVARETDACRTKKHNLPCATNRTKQAVGRETRALVVLGEAIEKWEHMPPAANGGGAASLESSRHEVFFDRGVIRCETFEGTFLRSWSAKPL